MMEAKQILTLSNWGNSVAVRIPKDTLDKLNLASHDKVELKVEKGSIMLTPQKPKSALEKMFEGYNGTAADYPFEVVDKGGAIGNELI